jgi:hypothetical protein
MQFIEKLLTGRLVLQTKKLGNVGSGHERFFARTGHNDRKHIIGSLQFVEGLFQFRAYLSVKSIYRRIVNRHYRESSFFF